MNTNMRFLTLIQRLGKPETVINADEELARKVNLGYRIVSEIVLPGDDVCTRVIRLESEHVIPSPEPESAIGKLVREHGSERANQILQQESIDRAWKAGQARLALYRNNPLPLPVFPIREDK